MAWGQITTLKGPQGDQGPTGATGAQGATGPTGADGAGIEIAGSVATYGDLPTGLGSGDAGAGYLVNANGKLYIWDGSAFPAIGSGVAFQGPTGATGSQGIQGPAGAQGIQGATGDTGAQGTAGTNGSNGATGPRGVTWFTGTGAPGAQTGQQLGDLYLDTADGTVYKLA